MEKEYKILVVNGDLFGRTYLGLRHGNQYKADTVDVKGDVDDKDLIAFAGRVAASKYKERLAKDRESMKGPIMKENVANAFIVDPQGMPEYLFEQCWMPSDNVLYAVSITMPFTDEKPKVDLYNNEDLKQLEISYTERQVRAEESIKNHFGR